MILPTEEFKERIEYECEYGLMGEQCRDAPGAKLIKIRSLLRNRVLLNTSLQGCKP
jgi:hypothetical protein